MRNLSQSRIPCAQAKLYKTKQKKLKGYEEIATNNNTYDVGIVANRGNKNSPKAKTLHNRQSNPHKKKMST